MSWLDRFLKRKPEAFKQESQGPTSPARSHAEPTPKQEEAATGGTVLRTPKDVHPGWILQSGQLLVGNYRIQQMVGSPGGMGQVFAAEDIALGLKVAIKVPSLNILLALGGAERFLREARIAARLGLHQHIVQIRACLTDPDLRIPVGAPGREIPIPFIVMEYLGGGDLARLLKDGPLDFPIVSNLFSSICSALQCAHSHVYKEGDKTVRGVIHRDLKPENICFDESGRLVIVDFGIARLLGDFSSSLGMAGTPSHMAPEQCNPTMGIDHRTDIYSLGIILFQMVTGRLPFSPSTYEGFMAAHLTQQPPDPRKLRPDLPLGVAEAILKALEKEKSARFDNVEQFSQTVAAGFKGARADVKKAAGLQVSTTLATEEAAAKGAQAELQSKPQEMLSAPSLGLVKAADDESLESCSHCRQQVQHDLVAGKLYCSNCGSLWVASGETKNKTNRSQTGVCDQRAGGGGPVFYTGEAASQQHGDPTTAATPPEIKSQTCPHCGNSAPPSFVAGVPYCSECGVRLQPDATPRPADRPQAISETACRSCGSSNPPAILSSGTYCPDCGRRIDA